MRSPPTATRQQTLLSTTRENLCTATKTCTAKKKINFIFLEKREAMSEFKERMCPVQLWMSIIGKVLGKSGECTGHISPPIVKKQANGDTFLKQGGKYSHHYQLWVYRFLSEFVHMVLLSSLRFIPIDRGSCYFEHSSMINGRHATGSDCY